MSRLADSEQGAAAAGCPVLSGQIGRCPNSDSAATAARMLPLLQAGRDAQADEPRHAGGAGSQEVTAERCSTPASWCARCSRRQPQHALPHGWGLELRLRDGGRCSGAAWPSWAITAAVG